MKFRITFKDPDGVYECIRDASESLCPALPTASMRKAASEQLRADLSEFAARWVDCDEYVTIEFDTEAKTAVVVEEGK